MNAHDFPVKTADGAIEYLSKYKGQLLLIVNVASKCGLTPQYEGLEALHRDNKDRLQVVGFPCNQFGDQEPGDDAEIQQFCSATYNVTFPVFSKVEVNGDDADPLFEYLRAEAPGDFGPDSGFLYEHVSKTRPQSIGTDEVKWNFTKFLVDREGEVVRRFEPTVTPEQIAEELAELL
ncbi:glutathione peroxidase [Rhodococcus sp. NPDC057014]|uniref:glutathione peroxidase n=1 Tax=Rhodococcus sp. NPDC057014 TaxID=3346000 RepID=UPI003639DCC3